MPVKPLNSPKLGRAEVTFREAFERLKRNKPLRVPNGTRVSQNNIAKEAGVDPSALKKARFPSLIAEIQRWIDEHGGAAPKSSRQSMLARRNHARDLRQRIKALELQRDTALGLLVEADARILELTIEVTRYQSVAPPSNVKLMRPPPSTKRR